jgi:hypothetical protein
VRLPQVLVQALPVFLPVPVHLVLALVRLPVLVHRQGFLLVLVRQLAQQLRQRRIFQYLRLLLFRFLRIFQRYHR